jgi:hypothetical protein
MCRLVIAQFSALSIGGHGVTILASAGITMHAVVDFAQRCEIGRQASAECPAVAAEHLPSGLPVNIAGRLGRPYVQIVIALALQGNAEHMPLG